MKQILLIILVLIVIGGGWYLYTQNAAAPETVPEANNTEENELSTDAASHDAMDEENSSTIGSDAGMEFPTMDVDQDAKVFNVTGQSFAFDTTEIRVREGDTVIINFESTGGFHDWVVDEFDAQTARVNTGGTTSVTFVANQKGTFEYYCSVGNHRTQGMVGTLIVE